MPTRAQPLDGRGTDVGVVCALELEAAPLVRRLARRRKIAGHRFVLDEGQLGKQRVAVIRSGTDARRLTAAADALASVHRPRWIVAAGFAVALDERLQPGDIVLASELANEAGERLAVQLGGASAGQPPGIHVGRLVTTAAPPRLGAEKRTLGERSGACAADLQSFPLARFCADHSIRFLAVRVIVHGARDDTAPEAMAVYHASRSFRVGAAVGTLLSGKGRMGRIWKLRDAARRSADRLAAVLCEILPSLA